MQTIIDSQAYQIYLNAMSYLFQGAIFGFKALTLLLLIAGFIYLITLPFKYRAIHYALKVTDIYGKYETGPKFRKYLSEVYKNGK